MTRHFLFCVLVVLVGNLDVVQAQCTDVCKNNCCSSCLVSTSGLDPANPAVCKLKCCWQCTSISDKTWGEAISAPEAQSPIASGSYFAVQMKNAHSITSVFVPKGKTRTEDQKILKTSKGLVKKVATQNGEKVNVFYYCAREAGELHFRGFSENGCITTIVYTQEFTGEAKQCEGNVPIVTVPGGGGDKQTPDPKDPSKCDPTTSAMIDGVCTKIECSAIRGYIKDGKCVCTSDSAGPPNCTGMPTWKWAVSIGGGVAALFSICVSIRAFMSHRKNKSAKEGDVEVVEVKNISPAYDNSPSYGKSNNTGESETYKIQTTPTKDIGVIGDRRSSLKECTL